MADAMQQGCDSVITIGGIQSNHCRATSTCATYLGLECHLILRNSERLANEDAGLVGNLLVERMQGAHIHQVRGNVCGQRCQRAAMSAGAWQANHGSHNAGFQGRLREARLDSPGREARSGAP
jgi:1-aminocyclopropane-1-carboxylate deaminase/D-cysteine desulfhydrase-like pyridoxal-dependent ACC family enzyme